jgi:hypothetical protein
MIKYNSKNQGHQQFANEGSTWMQWGDWSTLCLRGSNHFKKWENQEGSVLYYKSILKLVSSLTFWVTSFILLKIKIIIYFVMIHFSTKENLIMAYNFVYLN